MAINVALRKRPISKGKKESLYLDFWPPIAHPVTGEQTRRQYLNLFLHVKPKTESDKLHNSETRIKAEELRMNKDKELNSPNKSQGVDKEAGTRSFFDYFDTMANKREGASKVIWKSTLTHLKAFIDGDITFNDITEEFCNDFKEFLLKENITQSGRSPLSNNTARVYLTKFKAVLRQAHKDRLLSMDFNDTIQGIKEEETRREILTLNEVNALIQTECSMPIIKQAAIFSIYTGLRFSDIQKLTWGEIEEIDTDEYVINFKQKKTKGIETLPITKDALLFVGPKGKDTDKVFDGLLYSSYYNKVLAKWIGLAGITKHITFHSFRHTYATLQLTLGTDIYTVSKMLGHRDIKTTQIYAKIVDQTKRTAANKIQLNITDWK